jgi:nucleoside-diphosphate-sugar epimerase
MMTSNHKKEVVLLTGASGSMGFEAFKLLWERRASFDLVLLLRPSARNRKLFSVYEREAGISPRKGRHVARGEGLKIVWGDALNREDLEESCRGIDCCLHTMALISPAADRDPEMAYRVNFEVTRTLVELIEAGDPGHVKMVYIGSVAEYGDRLPPVHTGRCGDPILPSVYDHYALSKIRAEMAVMQSKIRHRVSLRQTFIMIPGLFSLMDPIMFHQPLNSFMENITSRDAGRALVKCLDVPEDSDFWGGYYNLSGGPACRITYLEFLDRIYRMLGLDYRKVMERNWFALKNFHMQFYEDAHRLNEILNHWEGGHSMEDYYLKVWKGLPLFLKAAAWGCRHFPLFRRLVEAATRIQLKKLALQQEGTLRWIKEGDEGRIDAFYGSIGAFRSIPGWEAPLPDLSHHQPYRRLDHGYDESKPEMELGWNDLRKAAAFRGGRLADTPGGWHGDLHASLEWTCCQGHSFRMTPHAVLKGGHWCLECISPPWNYGLLAQKNPFAAQVLIEVANP